MDSKTYIKYCKTIYTRFSRKDWKKIFKDLDEWESGKKALPETNELRELIAELRDYNIEE